MKKNSLLEISNLQTKFNTNEGAFAAVDDISLQINENEIVAIVGESGSGKTVTCLSIIDLVSSGKISGSIKFKEQELVGCNKKTLYSIRGKQISMIFQEPMTSLNPVFTIGQQIDETIKIHLKLNKKERKELIVKFLNLVGIPEPETRMNYYPHEFSGGMKQRIMIAMALSCNPALLIADEPTTALDVTTQAQILKLLKDLKDTLNMSIILVTHDLSVVANFAQRVIVMYGGKIVEEGNVKTIINNPSHPYTKGLINSIPKMTDTKSQPLNIIPGFVPGIANMPQGCRFNNRCALADDTCKNTQPNRQQLSEDHVVYCFKSIG